MRGQVIRLCDLKDVVIPEEKCVVSVDPAQVRSAVEQLSIRYAKKISVQCVEKGDVVYCRADRGAYPDGRSIILYTALELPGAEKAAKDAVGRHIGEAFETQINKKAVRLTVEKIIRPVPVEVSDSLVSEIGIENVSTVEDYRRYIESKMLEDQTNERVKMLVGDVSGEMLEKSVFKYDESDIERYINVHLDEIRAECAEEGVEVSDEDIRQGVTIQLKESWMAEAYCRKHGIEIDRAAVEAEIDQMLEIMKLMGETVPDREIMLEEALYEECLGMMFQHIEAAVREKMEG